MSFRLITPKRTTQSSLAGKTELQRLGHKIIADTRRNQQQGPRIVAPQRSAVQRPAQPRSVVQRSATVARPFVQRSAAAPQHSGVRREQPAAVHRVIERQQEPTISRGYVEPLAQPTITRGFVEEIPLRKYPRQAQAPVERSEAVAVEASAKETVIDDASAPEEGLRKAFESQLVFAPNSQLSDESPKLIRPEQN